MSDTTNPGQQLIAIMQGPAVQAYPTFTGTQQTQYADLVAAFNALSHSAVTDLRTQVYPFPLIYPPSSVNTTIQNLKSESGRWGSVYTQIATEVSDLAQLYGFQTAFQSTTQATNQAMQGGFQTAANNINNADSSGSVSMLGILGDILGAVNILDFEDVIAVSTLLGALLSIFGSMPDSDSITGKIDQLQSQLGTLIDQANNIAGQVYADICTDWGKLQEFAALLPSLQTNMQGQDYTIISNQYEIGVYQAVLPSLLAIVSLQGTAWGPCVNPSDWNQGLAYIPSGPNPTNYNGTICSRLTTLGVSLADVCGRSAGWSGLNSWLCTSTGNGVSCTNETPTPDSNIMTITSGAITNIIYVANSLVVTQGEPYSTEVTIQQGTDSGDEWTMCILADHNGSSDVATSFNNAVGGAGYAFSPNSASTKTPGKLNFYCAVQLVINTGSGPTTSDPIYFAQGHIRFPPANNWWIGGSSVNHSGSSATLTIAGNTFIVTGGNSSFELEVT